MNSFDESGGQPSNCSIEQWMKRIEDARVAKPRWQRGYVWTDTQVKELFEALLNRRPVGTLLCLACNSENRSPLFVSISLNGSPEFDESKLSFLILDGQQRLTSIWLVLTNKLDTDETYISGKKRQFFVKIKRVGQKIKQDDEFLVQRVECLKRNSKDEILMDDPSEAWKESFVPLRLFYEDTQFDECATETELENWCSKAIANDAQQAFMLKNHIQRLQKKLLNRDLSYYELPENTPREDAIDAFIKTNTMSTKVSQFDIAVAEFEHELSDQDQGLREKIEDIDIDDYRINRFFGEPSNKRISLIGETILKVACVLCELIPTDRQFTKSDVLNKLIENWDEIVGGVDESLKFLEEERIWDEKRLPSKVPLRVLPALFASGDFPKVNKYDIVKISPAKKLIRAYLWRSFVTDRYAQQANTRLFEDFKELREDLRRIKENKAIKKSAPIFDRKYKINQNQLGDLSNPVANPTAKNRLARAIVVASLRSGAKDFASGEFLQQNNLQHLHYHHLFPKAQLRKNAKGISRQAQNHALNFALIYGVTNQMIGSKNPAKYVETLEKAFKNSTPKSYISQICEKFDDTEVKTRVRSHVIPFTEFNVDAVNKTTYCAFIKKRASMMLERLKKLMDGEDISQ